VTTPSEQAGVGRQRPRFSRTQRGALAVVASAVGLDASSVAVVNAALPEIEVDLLMSASVLQWVITAYAVTFAGFLLFGGRLADVFSRRLVLAVGIGIFAVGSLASAVAGGTLWLILARAAQGIGGAISVPASTALLFEIFPPGPLRNKALGIFTSVAAGSFSGGLIFGGFLADLFGWRSVFAFTAVVAGVILLGARSTLPAGTTHRRPLDLPGTVAVTVGLLLAIFGVSRAGEAGWSDPLAVGAVVVGVVLLVGFVLWERRTSESLLPFDILATIPVWSAAVTAFVFFGIVLAELFFTPLYMQNMLGYSPMVSATALLAQSISVIVSANLTARLLDRGIGQHTLMGTGMLLLAAGMASFVRTPLDGSYLVHLFPGFVVVGAGIGVCHASMTAASLTGISRDKQGVAGAFNATAQQVGASMGTVVLVTVAVGMASGDGDAGELAGYHAAYWGAAFLGVAGAITVLLLGALHARRVRAPASSGALR
jgi:MFS family permease